jgi:hypothetical protein
MVTRLVHCCHEKYDVYIGRKNSRLNLPESKWANPYRIGIDGNRDDVIKKYKEWILNQPDLINNLSELEGKTLACWCYPKKCHGDILIELIYKSKLLAF